MTEPAERKELTVKLKHEDIEREYSVIFRYFGTVGYFKATECAHIESEQNRKVVAQSKAKDSKKSVTCLITNQDGRVVGTGSAYTHHKDSFCRDKGRKLSLTRAIKNASENKGTAHEDKVTSLIFSNKSNRFALWVEYASTYKAGAAIKENILKSRDSYRKYQAHLAAS